MGRMKIIILSTAAYDNWKPTSQSQYGLMHNKMKAETAIVLYMDVFFDNDSPSTIQVNITAARRIEGWAPAKKLNNHNPVIMNTGMSHLIFLFFRNGFNR